MNNTVFFAYIRALYIKDSSHTYNVCIINKSRLLFTQFSLMTSKILREHEPRIALHIFLWED